MPKPVKSYPGRIAVAAVTAGLLVAAVGACGSEVPGSPVRVSTDVSTLDVGNYPTEPREIGNAKNDREARTRESQRLGDYVALPFEADPSYVEDAWHIRPHVVLNQKALGTLVINDTFDEVAEDLVAGWVNSWSTGGPVDAPRRTMNLAVLMFPDAETAAEVGPTLEHDDFTYNPDNVSVQITKHPGTTAHWRPTVSSIGSWTVHDRYVIFIKVVDDTAPPDLPALTSQVERMLDVQVPLLDEFEPTPAEELSRVPLDPEGMVARTIPSNVESPLRADPDGYYTGRAALTLMESDSEDLTILRDHKIDLISFGDAVVFRSETGDGAETLWERWRENLKETDVRRMVDSPTGLGENVYCFADYFQPSEGEPILQMHICTFQVDRYAVQLASKQLQDLHQKTSAQYALLTRP
ncbi:DUF7373 family lipoprotein [Nocardia puris]|uniref:Lipoprotein LpqN n=1 Tax=Nocardia puris TaxID=208602 RepID=A0A366DHZ1_9NOCA|nr:hypothetical protein [Nocardia puris]RBO88868.1 hypothetical protein DFR74_10893 [Nocardia puris]